MYISLVLVVGHLYLALIHPTTRHALRGMTSGTVREDWARKHHAKWVRESIRTSARFGPCRPRLERRAAVAHNRPTMATILVVDDEQIVREVVVRYLAARRPHDARGGRRGRGPRAAHSRASPDLVVLDVMLPGTDGLELCRWIRGRSDLPVILLTARGEESDRIVGLELGADDYVTKPFSPRELAARVRTVLRRARPGATEDERRHASARSRSTPARARCDERGEALRLTAKEFDLLWFLARHPGKVFSRDQLMSSVWGYEAAFDTGTVTVHIRRLREKIERDPSNPRHLQTVWGVGYRLAP